jgi:hypothetical protein
MSSSRAALLAAVALLAAGCGPKHKSAPPTGTTMPPKVVPRPAGGGHTMAVSINGSTCSAGSYVNKPCVELTVCEPGGSSCVAIGDVLLDTGSFGLRLFKEVVPLTLPQVVVGGLPLVSCAQFADGSADWGPVRTADLYLGDAGPVTTAIQVIDEGYAQVPVACGKPDTSPAQAGLNGILGVGPLLEDCGPDCVTGYFNLYWGCGPSGCSPTTVPLAQQVKNPAALLAGLDNGLVIDLPAVGAGGAPSANGHVYFGIGSSADTNTVGITAHPINPSTIPPELAQRVNGVVGSGFLDTGSNALYFSNASAGTSLTACTGLYSGFYCSNATLTGAFRTGPSTWGTNFTASVVDLRTLLGNPSSNVYSNLAGALPGLSQFDWGLPFYLGRRVYQGYETRSSSLGTGPYQGF